METSRDLPQLSDFTPLSDFQSQTPTSFHSGPPVLYHHTPRATLKFSPLEAASSTAFSSFTNTQSPAPEPHAPTNGTNGSSAPSDVEPNAEEEENEPEANDEIEMNDVAVWVTSTNFILTHPPSSLPTTPSAGSTLSPPPVLKIPYPSISLHARSSPPPSLYLQLLSTSGPTFDDHDPANTIALTIIPSTSPTTSNSSVEGEDDAQTLYTALSACADLHPDPPSADGDDDGAFWNAADEGDDPLGLDQIDERGVGYLAYPAGDSDGVTALPPPMPGSGGWITAENVGEFFDEEGQVRGGGSLGDGAGRVRERDDGEEEGGRGSMRG
ncbi:MAG: hypothetical protein OHK93_003844 [Ramalina farinacea]|uniref:Uncharacterized protein n=1 Tax=Ramalina farinacea TaxID=258253 RepID=A0AA43TSX4_9LECA|nr:hypothetical protein [Ramalina farinacea]